MMHQITHNHSMTMHTTCENMTINEIITRAIDSYINNIICESDTVEPINNKKNRPYNPRTYIPKVRGGWTEKKILRYLKSTSTPSGVVLASRAISEFDSPEELKEHMFYHGTVYGPPRLKPSITMSDREAERVGGGGYGDKYWGISVSKSKQTASHFSGTNHYVKIYPIILRKGANVIERPDFTDAYDVGEHIVELWNQGVDAVHIGGGGEDELLILNPEAVVNIGTSDFYDVYQLGTVKNPIKMPSDEDIETMFYTARELCATHKPSSMLTKPYKKHRTEPFPPSLYNSNEKRFYSDDEYKERMDAYNNELSEYERQMKEDEIAYQEAMKEYERKKEEFENSEQMLKYKEILNKANKHIRF